MGVGRQLTDGYGLHTEV